MGYIEAPEYYKGVGKSLFLAGGIRGCPDWRSDLICCLEGTDLVLLNPKRKEFPAEDPNAMEDQIKWEHYHLGSSTANLFWFPKEAVDTMTLYELGAWSRTKKPMFVGIHPEYSRRRDLEVQMGLARPDVEIVYDLESLANQVRKWAGH